VQGNQQLLRQHRTDAVALLIVLAFVALLSVLVVAYFNRTGTDRLLAGSSFNQANADNLAKSALAIIVGDIKQEVFNGGTTITIANIVPQRSETQTNIPNLIRRSVRSDAISAPGVGSRASPVNSTTDVSTNGRSVSLARWNGHYLIPKNDTSNDRSDPIASFVAPDWVLITRAGPSVQTNLGNGTSALNNPIDTNPNYVIGRFGYAIYDEGGLLDINVAGFPSPTPAPATSSGRKGTVAFADLTALPTTGSSFVSNTAINRIIGWRNYATVQPSGSFPSFSFTPTASTTFANYFLGTVRNFGTISTTVSGGRTDQGFVTRGELIQLRADIAASVNMLQYLGTFSRELNRPTSGSLTARWPLSRFENFATTPPSNPASIAAIQTYFGLRVVAAASGPPAVGEHWEYDGTSGNTRQSTIPSVPVSADSDLPSLLKNILPSGTSTGEILSIVASLIDQRDTNSDTTWIEFGGPGPGQKAYGVDVIPVVDPSPSPSPAPRPANVVVLDRAFRNVGELGYAYRNASTTLDFLSAGSSDAPLLDLFTYNTATTRSGTVSLNTRNPSILAALIKGAITTESSSATVSNANAKTAADTIVTATTNQPALGRHEVARLASVVTNAPFTTSEETRETIARSLAEVGQTRTWGLMIDVIAQSGRYPPNATSGPNVANPLANFVVEGEKRYWLHIAIDRFTGQVIDQQLEAVYE
jgi:hypothetical protein